MKIEFHTYKHLDGIIPRPKPAAKCLPKWYKNMPVQVDEDDPTTSTIKRCVPVRDAMSAGYIIPLWADVNIVGMDGDLSYASSPAFGQPVITTHSVEQVRGCPISDKNTYGSMPLKFENPWIIKTEPGYSCLFMAPIGHFENRFKIIMAVVDTDKYYNHVNFPFILKKKGSNFIRKNTPLVQVIPFKREEWESEYSYDLIDEDEQKRAATNLGTYLNGAYKEEYWEYKSYK